MEATQPIVVVISDLHCGSKVAICPPEITISDQTTFKANKLQLFIWQHWLNFWQWVDDYRGDREYILLINGDLTEGFHHGAKQVLGERDSDHSEMALVILDEPTQKAKKVYVCEGTECHTSTMENSIARVLGAEQHESKAYAPSHWDIDIDGHLYSMTHHIGTTSRAWLQKNQLGMTMANERINRMLSKRPQPQVMLRAHRHTFSYVGDTHGIMATSFPWQFKTRHANKVVPESATEIGGLIIDHSLTGDGWPVVIPYGAVAPGVKAAVA